MVLGIAGLDDERRGAGTVDVHLEIRQLPNFWRTQVLTLKSLHTLTRSLILIGTGFVLNTSAALAGDSSVDAQQWAQNLLSPPVRHPQQAAVSVPHSRGRGSWPDAQSLARNVIIGTHALHASGKPSAATLYSQAKDGRCGDRRPDAQQLAREVVLGRPECAISNSAQPASHLAVSVH